MQTIIKPVRLGVVTCYLIRQDGTVLVDAGSKTNPKALWPSLDDTGIRPEEISLVFITHGHWDHYAGAQAIRERTNALVAVNQREKSWIEQGLNMLPPAISLWGGFFRQLLVMGKPFTKLPPTPVDIDLPDQGLSLEPYGIAGRIILTPGHTFGSMSLVLDTGDAFVGDLAMNGLPMRIGPGLPALGDDADQVMASWRILLNEGAKTIYPAHGKPFPADVLRRALSHG
jgi:glyoxylase-like metal-dependent hydrolase (beta-lactamase superfamily II)